MARRNWASEQLRAPESGSLIFFRCIGSPVQGTGGDVAIVVFTPVLAYIVDGLSAISSMLLNLCMYTPVSINLLSSKHCRYVVAVIFTFLIKCSICYLLYMSKNL